jgi:ribonuclease R
MAERRADAAVWDVEGWLKCEFMQGHIGDYYYGTINAVTSFGLFVELIDVYVEGLVHISALPGDYYHFDAPKHRLLGERSGRSFRLGDIIEVQVMRVDLDEKKIDFELADEPPKPAKPKFDKSKSGKSRSDKPKFDNKGKSSRGPRKRKS